MVTVRPIHGGLGGHFVVVLIRFTVFWIHGGLGAWGARNSVPPWTDTHTLAGAGFREPKRLKSFENKGPARIIVWGKIPASPPPRTARELKRI